MSELPEAHHCGTSSKRHLGNCLPALRVPREARILGRGHEVARCRICQLTTCRWDQTRNWFSILQINGSRATGVRPDRSLHMCASSVAFPTSPPFSLATYFCFVRCDPRSCPKEFSDSKSKPVTITPTPDGTTRPSISVLTVPFARQPGVASNRLTFT